MLLFLLVLIKPQLVGFWVDRGSVSQNGLAFPKKSKSQYPVAVSPQAVQCVVFLLQVYKHTWVVDAVSDDQQYASDMAKSTMPSTKTVVTCILWPDPACMLLAGYLVHGPCRRFCKPCISLCENGCESRLITCYSYAAALLKRKLWALLEFACR